MKDKLDIVFKIFIMVMSLFFLILYSQSHQIGRYVNAGSGVLDTVTGTVYWGKKESYGKYMKKEYVPGAKDDVSDY